MRKIASISFVLVNSALAQTAPQPLPGIEHLHGNNYLFSWDGVPGRVYFVQTSSQPILGEGFVWEFAPDIRVGEGDILSMGFEANIENAEFFRLVYVDPGDSEDPDFADYDGDGYVNLQEAMENTDPFDALSKPTGPKIYKDSDGDGISDQDETVLGLDPQAVDDSSLVEAAGPLLISHKILYEYSYDEGDYYLSAKGTGIVASQMSQQARDSFRIDGPWDLSDFVASFNGFSFPMNDAELDRSDAYVKKFKDVFRILPSTWSRSVKHIAPNNDESNIWHAQKVAHMLKLPIESNIERQYSVLVVPRHSVQENLGAFAPPGPEGDTDEERATRIHGIEEGGIDEGNVRLETFTIPKDKKVSNILEFDFEITEVREDLWTQFSMGLLPVEIKVYRPAVLKGAIPWTLNRDEKVVPQEEMDEKGVGIRVNQDDDNGNSIGDSAEVGAVNGENDLIEIEFKNPQLPEGFDVVIKKSPVLKVWGNKDKSDLVAGAGNEAVVPENLEPPRSYWVESIVDLEDGELEFLLRPKNGGADVSLYKIPFYTYKTFLIGLSGETFKHKGDILGQAQANGMYSASEKLYLCGYNISYYDEDVVGDDGEGIPFEEIESQVKNCFVRKLGIFGHSHGGGSTYNLSKRLNDRRGGIGQFSILYTAYVDAVKENSILAENRFPPSSSYLLNYYQRYAGLRGDAVAGADNHDVTANGWGHGGIDDNVVGPVTDKAKDKTDP